jgi:hypothetical protein
MARWGAHRFPPRRLAALSDAQLRWVRPLWFLVLVAAIVLDMAGAVFVLRDAYESDPAYHRFALASSIDDDGFALVEGLPGNPAAPPVTEPSRIVAIDGRPVPRDSRLWDLAEQLKKPAEKPVALTILGPDGEQRVHLVTPNPRYAIEAAGAVAIPREVRIWARIVVALITCSALIACAVLLFMRRPRDPVALLFSFSFLLFAGSIDPPLNMWLSAGYSDAFGIYTGLAWLCLVIGITAFPDGRFNPPFVRWILIVAPLCVIPVIDDDVPMIISTILAFGLPLALLLSQAIKYRRLEPGIERQQIKWAAFGFATGLVLLAAAVELADLLPTDAPQSPIYGLIVLGLFNAGFLAMVIGLLVSLLRFRLWEADQVISRSAVAAAVTLAVGILWTLSTDLVKTGVEMTLGEENLAVATVASAVLAAGIFAPTQALAQRWAKRKFDGDNDRIRNLISRLAVWRTSETPEEIGMRSLSALAAAVHCSSAAIVLDTPHGRSVVASRDIEDGESLARAGGEKFVLNVPLEDEDGPIGQLLLGPRSDLNRYNSSQTAGILKVAEPLAEAFRAAVKRAQHSDSVQRLLGSVEERLARLEGGGGGLSPA